MWANKDVVLVQAVFDRINQACEAAMRGEAPMIVALDVTPDEEAACKRAVIENLKERGEPPIPYCDHEGRLLLKGVGLRVRVPAHG